MIELPKKFLDDIDVQDVSIIGQSHFISGICVHKIIHHLYDTKETYYKSTESIRIEFIPKLKDLTKGVQELSLRYIEASRLLSEYLTTEQILRLRCYNLFLALTGDKFVLIKQIVEQWEKQLEKQPSAKYHTKSLAEYLAKHSSKK